MIVVFVVLNQNFLVVFVVAYRVVVVVVEEDNLVVDNIVVVEVVVAVVEFVVFVVLNPVVELGRSKLVAGLELVRLN